MEIGSLWEFERVDRFAAFTLGWRRYFDVLSSHKLTEFPVAATDINDGDERVLRHVLEQDEIVDEALTRSAAAGNKRVVIWKPGIERIILDKSHGTVAE